MLALVLAVLAYFLFCMFGAGFYLLLCPFRLRDRRLFPWLMPAFGCMAVILVASWAMIAGKGVGDVPSLTLGCSLICIVASLLLYHRNRILREMVIVRQVWRHRITLILIPVAIAVLLLLPILRFFQPETAFHIGSDQVGYGIGAQYLLKGGKLATLEEQMKQKTGISDLVSAVENYNNLVDFSTAIQSNNLLQGRRWGVPALSAVVASVLKQTNAYSVLFLLLAFFQLGLFYISNWVFSVVLGVERRWAVLGAVALTLNCNLLNILIEGGYAQVYTVPAFFLLWMIPFVLNRPTAQEVLRGGALVALLLSHILLTYSDLFYLAIGLTGMTFLLRTYLVRTIDSFKHFFFHPLPLGVLFALVANSSYLIGSILDLSSKMKHNQAGGFWQPLWAWPSEIFGFIDMYCLPQPGAETILHHRSNFLIAIGVIVSLVSVAILLRRSRSLSWSWLLIWLMPLLFCVGILCKQVFWDHWNNYQYLKAYTYMLPLMWVGFWEAVQYFSVNVRTKLMAAVIAVWICVIGAKYQVHMSNAVSLTSPSMQRLAELSERYDFKSRVIITAQSGIAEMMLGGFIPMNWANQGKDINLKRKEDYMDRTVLLVFNMTKTNCRSCLYSGPATEFVVETENYVLVGLKKKLAESIDATSGKVRPDFFLAPYAAFL